MSVNCNTNGQNRNRLMAEMMFNRLKTYLRRYCCLGLGCTPKKQTADRVYDHCS